MRINSKAFLVSLAALAAAVPLFVSAHDISLFPLGYWGPLLSCTGNYLGSGAKCTSVCDILHTLQHLIYFAITLVIFVLAPIMFLAGGIMVAMGGANPAVLGTGKKILWRTLAGVVIALGSFAIIATFLWLVGNPGTGGVAWPQIQCNPSQVPGGQIDPSIFKSGYEPGAGYSKSGGSVQPAAAGYGCLKAGSGGGIVTYCSPNQMTDCSDIKDKCGTSPCVLTERCK